MLLKRGWSLGSKILTSTSIFCRGLEHRNELWSVTSHFLSMSMSNLSFYVTAPSHFLLMLLTIMLVDVIDPYHFLSMLQTKMLVDVKIFDLNDPTRWRCWKDIRWQRSLMRTLRHKLPIKESKKLEKVKIMNHLATL